MPHHNKKKPPTWRNVQVGLPDALINELHLDDTDALLGLAAACLVCEVDDVAWVEV